MSDQHILKMLWKPRPRKFDFSIVRVSYCLEEGQQHRVGELVKAGSRYVYVRERNVPDPKVIKLSIRDNQIQWLLGDKNPFESKKRRRKK